MTTNQWEEQAYEQSRTIEPKDQPPKKVVRSFLRQVSSSVVHDCHLVHSHASINLTFDLPKTNPGIHLALSGINDLILRSPLSKKKEDQVIQRYPPPQPLLLHHQHLWRTPLELGPSPPQTFTTPLLSLASLSTETPLPCCQTLKRMRIHFPPPHSAHLCLLSHLPHHALRVRTLPHPQFLQELSLQLLLFPPGRDNSNVCPPECNFYCIVASILCVEIAVAMVSFLEW